MKFLTVAASALLASSVSARSSLFGSSIEVAPFDEALKVPGDNPLQHCKDPKDDILDLESVDLSPNPPKPGKTLTITATGTLSQNVTKGATVHLQVKYGLITIVKQTADLCETVKNVDLKCPIEKGEMTLEKDVDLPKEIPPGKYHVIADVYTKDEDKVTCLTATVEFKRGGGSVVHQGLK
ncbi:Phosphatidylglycerol/phosphatidylinositol transfer protein [Vermiconidia calcicola]|uniref:Phosphatidylglycerol/phosphatidylinositol transfer protein n=1 Tax=Vermiconidia calcicola TaxID=1690605 RepID=A0ACC3MHT1_9PEZI|nr:Phosphatidylglycerol/phosphatidylinositol transfer protein [Vermiconidia calcicola]